MRLLGLIRTEPEAIGHTDDSIPVPQHAPTHISLSLLETADSEKYHVNLFAWCILHQAILHFERTKAGNNCKTHEDALPEIGEEWHMPNLLNLYMRIDGDLYEESYYIRNIENVYKLIPELFRLKMSTRHRVMSDIRDVGHCAFKVLDFIRVSFHRNIRSRNIAGVQFKARFNMKLTRLLPLLNDVVSADENMNFFRLLLLNTRFFDRCTHKDLHIDITAPERVLKPAKPVGGGCVVKNYGGRTSRERKNYDAYPTEEDQFVFKVGDNGVQKYFGFSNSEELLQFLIFCIDKTTLKQLIVVECPSDSTSAYLTCGSINYTPAESDTTTIFMLDLILPHDDTTVTLRSDSTKLLHWLTRTYMTPTQMSNYLQLRHRVLDETVGFYPAFQRALEKRIGTFIGIRFKQGGINLSVIPCYRPECGVPTILEKSLVKYVIQCRGCGISEFCSLCHDIDHGTAPCELTRDQASEALIAESSKPCPECTAPITKNGGCNHMICEICSTHFCWLCGMKYTPNEINAHYTIGDNIPNPSGMCIGLQAQDIDELDDDA
jgi:hypothetical protein